jgi:hypothetical protein
VTEKYPNDHEDVSSFKRGPWCYPAKHGEGDRVLLRRDQQERLDGAGVLLHTRTGPPGHGGDDVAAGPTAAGRRSGAWTRAVIPSPSRTWSGGGRDAAGCGGAGAAGCGGAGAAGLPCGVGPHLRSVVDLFERHARVTLLIFDYTKYILRHREGPIVTLQDFKTTFRDGSTQTVTADQHNVGDAWIVFYDNNGQVLRVPESDVTCLTGTWDVARS